MRVLGFPTWGVSAGATAASRTRSAPRAPLSSPLLSPESGAGGGEGRAMRGRRARRGRRPSGPRKSGAMPSPWRFESAHSVEAADCRPPGVQPFFSFFINLTPLKK